MYSVVKKGGRSDLDTLPRQMGQILIRANPTARSEATITAEQKCMHDRRVVYQTCRICLEPG